MGQGQALNSRVLGTIPIVRAITHRRFLCLFAAAKVNSFRSLGSEFLGQDIGVLM